MGGNTKQIKIYIIGDPEKEENQNEAYKIFKDIMTKIFQNLIKAHGSKKFTEHQIK